MITRPSLVEREPARIVEALIVAATQVLAALVVVGVITVDQEALVIGVLEGFAASIVVVLELFVRRTVASIDTARLLRGTDPGEPLDDLDDWLHG